MEANAGLLAGSHNRNELVVIRQEGDGVRHGFCWPCVSFVSWIVGWSAKLRTADSATAETGTAHSIRVLRGRVPNR